MGMETSPSTAAWRARLALTGFEEVVEHQHQVGLHGLVKEFAGNAQTQQPAAVRDAAGGEGGVGRVVELRRHHHQADGAETASRA